MPIKKFCTCGARYKRCPVHLSVSRRRVYHRLRKAPEPTRVEKLGAQVKVFQGVLKVGVMLLQAVHLILLW